MITIYHNNRCRKSREGLEILENSGNPFEIKKYLEEVPTKKELQLLISKLGIKPVELVRKNEAIWKEKFKDRTLTDTQIIDALIEYPKLIERPIVVNGDKAIIGRPPESILNIL